MSTSSDPLPVGSIAYSRKHRDLVRVLGHKGKSAIVASLFAPDRPLPQPAQNRSLKLMFRADRPRGG